MALNRNRKQPDWNAIKNKTNEYSFFQVIRYYEKIYSNLSSKPLRLLTNNSLAFPASDIVTGHAISPHDGELCLLINFLGLYGVDSPLPQTLNYKIFQDNKAAQTFKAFLDIFNQQFYWLFYLSWRKFRVELQLEAGGYDFLCYLSAIAGNKLKLTDGHLLKYFDVFGRQEANTMALIYLIRDLFALSVTIDELGLHWIKLAKASFIGKNYSKLYLGDNSILGAEILSTNNVLIINLEPISIKYYIAKFIHGTMLSEIKHVLQLYLPWHISYKLNIKVLFGETHRSLLAKVNTMLGVNCCLGDADSLQNVFSFV